MPSLDVDDSLWTDTSVHWRPLVSDLQCKSHDVSSPPPSSGGRCRRRQPTPGRRIPSVGRQTPSMSADASYIVASFERHSAPVAAGSIQQQRLCDGGGRRRPGGGM